MSNGDIVLKWLYCIRNKITGKEYIGVTIDPKRRWRQHQLRRTQCSALKDAMNKYGVDNFEFTLLCCGKDEYIDELEVKAIATFNTQVPNGYNITLGGEGTMYYEWNSEWDKLLGTMKDRDLSGKLNVPHHTIGERRRALNIPTYLENCIQIFKDNEHLLSVKSDEEISEICGLSVFWVQKERLKRGMLLRSSPTRYIIESGDIHYLEDTSLTQKVVSEKTNIPIGVVNKWRRERGIRFVGDGRGVPFDPPQTLIEDLKDAKLTYEQLSLKYKIGKTKLLNLSKSLGVSRKLEFTDDMDKVLWESISDEEAGKVLGVGEDSVRKRRRVLGVPKRSCRKNEFLMQEPYYSRIIDRWSVCKDLADEWGVPHHQVTHIKRKYQKENPLRVPKNLSKEDWLYIRYLYENGISYKAIIYNLGLEIKRHDDICYGLKGVKFQDVTGFKQGEINLNYGKRSNK